MAMISTERCIHTADVQKGVIAKDEMMWGMEIGKRLAQKRMRNTAEIRKGYPGYIGMASTLYTTRYQVCRRASIPIIIRKETKQMFPFSSDLGLVIMFRLLPYHSYCSRENRASARSNAFEGLCLTFRGPRPRRAFLDHTRSVSSKKYGRATPHRPFCGQPKNKYQVHYSAYISTCKYHTKCLHYYGGPQLIPGRTYGVHKNLDV